MSRRPTKEQIKSFLDLFDDPSAAPGAIRDYELATGNSADSLAKEAVSSRASSLPRGETLVSVDDLIKHYDVNRQKIEALQSVSLTVQKGEFIVLTGASGSGKSTLLQLIGGLDRPSSGNITINGTDLGRMSDRDLSRFRGQTIGFVFQFFYLQPFLTLMQNIEVPGMFTPAGRQGRHARAKQLAEAVGLSERLYHLPKELSGGQIQRVAIARALLNNPKVLLADEPTGNLDSQNSTAIIDLFDKIRREFGTTIIVATHDPDITARADRVITLKDGAIV